MANIRGVRHTNKEFNSPLDDTDNVDHNPKNTEDNLKNKEEIRVRRHDQALQDPSLLTNIRFSDLDLHPMTRKALVDGLGLQTMTHVQAKTYGAAREGKSILAHSRTGTGKTLAFLLPTIERLLDLDLDLYNPSFSIGMVVIAPTRELAIQIADQCEILLGFHNKYRHNSKQLTCACIYGGVKMQRDVRLLMGDHRGRNIIPTILVSTPARLLEHLEGNSPLSKNYKNNQHQKLQRKKSKFADLVANTKIVVLDETDRLLQGSNLYDTQRILSFMARTEKRQTLLFSATFPRKIRRLLSNSSIVKKKKKATNVDHTCGTTAENKYSNEVGDDDFIEVNCIDDVYERINVDKNKLNKLSTSTSRIEESYVVLQNLSQFIPLLLTILRREQQRDSQNYKILVFFPTVRLVRFLFQFIIMYSRGGDNSNKRNTSQLLADDNNFIWEIHSRMSQSSREKASNSFRNARRGILFSSDVSARGLDYPDISLVVQMGAPSSDQDYIHRIGRTGRAGNLGRSLLVLLPFEKQQKQEHWKKAQRRKPRRSSYYDDDNLKEDKQLSLWLGAHNEEGNRNKDGGEREENHKRLPSISPFQECQDDLKFIRLKIRSGHVVLTPSAQAAYISFLAHYTATTASAKPNRNKIQNNKNNYNDKNKTRTRKLQPSRILAYANDFAIGTGLATIPELDEAFLSKLGL